MYEALNAIGIDANNEIFLALKCVVSLCTY